MPSTTIKLKTQRSSTPLACCDETRSTVLREATFLIAPDSYRFGDAPLRHARSSHLASGAWSHLGEATDVQRERRRLDHLSVDRLLPACNGEVGHRGSRRGTSGGIARIMAHAPRSSTRHCLSRNPSLRSLARLRRLRNSLRRRQHPR